MNNIFTEYSYRHILSSAIKKFRFLGFSDSFECEMCTLWRHDVDFSPHRALALARIEAELGVKSTFFIQLASRYYNVFEPEIKNIINEIALLGHELGLHFDPECYNLKTFEDIQAAIAFEAQTLNTLFNIDVVSFSLHNPTVTPELESLPKVVANIINASSYHLYEQFTYCSDSNGTWRFRDLLSVINDSQTKKLYALTHPEWWQVENMPPRKALQRCIDGRAMNSATYYDGLLQKHNRPNLDVHSNEI